MSASKHVTLWCDADWCNNWTDHGRSSITETRQLAQLEGWVRSKGKDFCCTAHWRGERTASEELDMAWDAKYRKALEEASDG